MKLNSPLRVYVGWDPRDAEAYRVCKYSLERRASIPVKVQPIVLSDMREQGLYNRHPDPMASSEFTYSRFLVPRLAGYHGWAVFCDPDFLWLDDIAKLFAQVRPTKPLWCVQHDHRPPETTKADGKPQSVYPRKNWSSLMIMNCSHPAVRNLTGAVNTSSPAYLHRMQWLRDVDIGALPVTWNWLEGWNTVEADGVPSAVHFTRGGPWLEACQYVEFADHWLAERQHMRDIATYRKAMAGVA